MNGFYLTGAQTPEFFPQFEGIPEIAFIGRSNTGKSSLINGITGQKNLARKSHTPGRTQMAHFFQLEKSKTEKIILTDLPGYGYSVAKKDIQKLWDELISIYLDRPFIQMFCCLFDIRREIEDFEWVFLKNLSQKNSHLALILTKSDKISFAEQKRKIAFMEEQLKARHISCPFGVFGVSNLNKKGIDDLRQIFFQS